MRKTLFILVTLAVAALLLLGASSTQWHFFQNIKVANIMSVGSSFVFEGAVEDSFETTISVTEPTADSTVTLTNRSGSIRLGEAAYSVEVCPNTASAATLTANNCNSLTITGAATVTTLNTCDSSNDGRILYILCGSSTATFTDGGNMKLAGNLVCTSDDLLQVLCDGVNWVELARSVN